MARRKRKRSSAFGPLVIEVIAVIGFALLFMQAKAERQHNPRIETGTFPVIQGMFEQTPFRNMLARQ